MDMRDGFEGQMVRGKWRPAFAVTLLCAVVPSIAATVPSMAASRVCRLLETELAATSGSRGSPAQIRKYDAAIVRQGGEITKARGRARASGCGFSLFGANVSECAAINAAIDRMNGNLDTLQRKRAQLAGGGSRRERARIVASLDANNCGERASAGRNALQAGSEIRGAYLSGQLGGDGDRPRGTFDEPEAVDQAAVNSRIIRPALSGTQRAGEYRTLCVRTCDGYFFPMSNAATFGDFERDQKNCESSCPGTDIRLFYTRGMSDEPATMISSANGKPYSELPTAFLYKRTDMARPPACGCNAARNFQIIAGSPRAGYQGEADGETRSKQAEGPAAVQPRASETSSFVTMPAIEPVPSTGPETQASAAAPAAAIRPTAPADPEDRKVRAVGPAFLPDPSAAIDLRAPAPRKVR